MPSRSFDRIVAALALLGLSACGLWVGNPKPKGDTSTKSFVTLPLIRPPVEAATPLGLHGAGGLHLDLPTGELKSRFFAEGPTDILGILSRIDGRIQGFNQRAADGGFACLTQEPVAYDVAPFGDAMTFYAQCYESMTTSAGDQAFIQYGQHEGKTYLFYAVGQERVAVIASPVEGSDADLEVRAWMGVGYLNAQGCGQFDECSYGVMALTADSRRRSFEMAVAGLGFGYCGAQLRSDGHLLFATGSVDALVCEEPESLCVMAADLGPADDCSALAAFELGALGRDATSGSRDYGASLYPETPNVVLDGTASDSLHFGPEEPTPGVGLFGPGG